VGGLFNFAPGKRRHFHTFSKKILLLKTSVFYSLSKKVLATVIYALFLSASESINALNNQG
jgi:hypothetical protein